MTMSIEERRKIGFISHFNAPTLLQDMIAEHNEALGAPQGWDFNPTY